MVALRNKKAKAKAASRKAIEKAATKQRATAAAAAKTDDAASADVGDSVEESAEERVRKLVAFLTHAALAIPVTAVTVVEGEEHDNPAKTAAANLNKMLTRTDVAPFLDAMIVAQCASVKDKALSPQQILSRLTSASRKRICGVIFKADEIAYSCRNCQVDSTCVICKDCFMLGDHSGHDVYFQRTTAGSSCDCGDFHAWKRTGFCSRHPGAQEDHDTATSKKTSLPKALASMAPVVIEAVVDFLYQVYLGIDQGFEFAEALEVFSRDIPPSLLADLVAPRNTPPAIVAASPPPTPAAAPVASIDSRRRPCQGGSRRSSVAVDTVRTSTANSRPIPSPSPSTAQNLVVRLHNDDVHSLGEVIKDLCAAMGCGSFQARASVSEADRQGDSVVAKMSLVKCAAPVSSLVRASLNISVVPVWWEKQMERVPAILEWLRTISMTSDGLYELVSEAIRKKRSRRLGPPATISSFFAKGTTCSSFWRAHRVRLHPTTQAIIDEVTNSGSDDDDLHGWGAELEERFQQMYKFSDTDDAVGALPLSHVEQCDNVLIVEFLQSVTLNPAYGRYQCVREGCNALMTRFFVANDKAPSSLLGVMVRWDCALRKRVAHLGHALLREHMLNKTFRKCMLESYATSYGAMTQSYLKGLGTSPDSIFDFAVQFLTVPQLVKDYTRTEVEKDPSKPQLAYELLSATEKVLAAAVKKAASDGEEDTLNVDHPALSSQKYKHCIDDLEYVFNVGALPNELVCDDRNLGLWISCLKMLQNGDLQARRGIRESHVEYESDSWLSMFNLGIRVHSIFPVSWNGMTPEALANKQQTVKHISQQIIDTVISSSIAANQKTTTKTIVPIKALRCGTNGTSKCEVYDFNVSASKTSLHVPLHRFLASSIRHVSIHVSWLQDVLNAEGLLAAFALDQLPSEKKIELVELPLRSLVMASQIQSNLWRRNGEENMMAQLYNYSALPYCVHYRDADVFLMQVAILLLGPDTLLSLMVDRFQLGDFFKCQRMGYAPQEEGVDAQQELQMVEEFLRLIIVLGTSLPSSSGEEYENQFMEEEMLQHLCAKPASFSKLFDIAMLPTGQDDVSVPRLEGVLTRVADFSPPSGLDPGRYELKEGLLEAYNPYCLHLNREAHELARDRWTNYRKAQRLKHSATSSTPLIAPPLKRMQRPLRFLHKARTILTCEGTLTLVHVILWTLAQDVTANSGGGTGFTVSDAVISTMLHLLAYGVYAAEEAREDHGLEVNADAFWAAMCTTAEALGDSSLISLLWSLRGGKGHSASGLLDDDQISTLDWLLSKGRECSTDCAEALDRLEQSDRDAKHTASGQRSVSGSNSGSLATQAAESMEQRKDEARKRALEAMARQQAAFQAMMADMGDEDEEDMEAEPLPGDLNEEGNSSTALGKRRASVDDAATDAEDSKRPRLSDAAHEASSSCYKCILCHDTATQGEMGMAAYVHQSTVLTGSFRPDPEEGLQPRGNEVRKQVKALIEKMDLCSGGPTVSSNSPSPALRALAAQFPDWYMDDGFDEELMLDPPMPHLNAVGNQRQIRHNTGTNADQNARNQRRRPAIEAFLMGQDEDDMEMLEGVLDLREDQRLFPLPILGGTAASPDRRDRGVRRPPGADRGIVVARRGAPMPGVESDFDDDDSDEYDEDDHQFHHHHHHHHHHNHNHSPRRPRSHSRTASVPLHLTPCGLHIRTCQHAVHIHCLERYIRSLHEKAIRGEDFDGVQAIDPDAAMTQFLCPLCKTLCNFLIPTSDPGGNDPRLAIVSRGADTPNESSSSWYAIVERQLKVPGWYRAVLGRDGDFGDGDNDAHDMWRDYFEETLWEPHGSLEKGAPFLWSACAFSVASFLNVADEEFESTSSSGDFDPLTQSCPPSVEKEFTSLIAVTKFCRWSFSLLEHSEDAKVIWETAKRCNPINTETKREYRKFTKVLGSIDACLRGTILGLLVADTFTAFVISSVIADTPATIWQCIPVFSAADFLQRVYTEFFVQSKTDDRSLLQDKFSILKDSLALNAAAAEAVLKEVPRRTRRSSRLAIQPDAACVSRESEHKPSGTKAPSAKDVVRAMQESEGNKDSEEYAVLTLLARILESEPEEQLKPLTKHTVTTRLQRIKTFNGLLVQRMKLFYRCLADETRGHVLDPSSLAIPSATDIAASPKPVFSQVWKWCVDRIKSKSYLGSAKDGDKCEHAEGCGEGYIASMFILRDQVRKPRLIELPVQYDELYGAMSGRKCARCNKAPCDPGICLLCGEFLCCGDACCSHPYVNHGPQVGECTRHAAECGGGIGIVLMLDQCRVAIIGGSMAAHFPCPYVDAHGEEDVGLQRGRPLRLDAARYRYLESLWLNHRIFAEVSRLRNQREPQFTINLSYL